MAKAGKYFGQWSLRTRLLVPLTLAVSPLVIFGMVQSFEGLRTGEKLRYDQLIATAARAITEAEYELARAEGALRLVSARAGPNDCRVLLEQLSPTVRAVSNVAIFNADAISTCTVKGVAGSKLQDLTWNTALEAGAPVVLTPAFFGLYSQDWIFALLGPRLEESGAFAGSVSLGLYVDRLLEPLKIFGRNGTEVSLVDDTGKVLGSTRFTRLPQLLLQNVPASGNPLKQTMSDQRGARYDTVLVRLIGANVFALVSREQPAILSVEALRPTFTFALPFATFLLTLSITWLTIEGLVLRWVRSLSEQAKSFGRGEYQPVVSKQSGSAPLEIGELAETFDAMAAQIGSRETQLLKAVELKDAAIREIHHRVKNNLQIVSSFLSLQSRATSSSDVKEALTQTRSRINALSIIHQTLYQHEQLDVVELPPFFDVLLTHLSDALGVSDLSIKLEWHIDSATRTPDDAIPLALFTLEAVTNAMKYAFDEKGGTISVTFTQNEAGARLTVSDNGRGDSGEVVGTGLGSKLITAFARQVRGTTEIQSNNGLGYSVALVIPRTTPELL